MKKEQIEEFVDIIGEFIAGLAIISVIVLSIYSLGQKASLLEVSWNQQ